MNALEGSLGSPGRGDHPQIQTPPRAPRGAEPQYLHAGCSGVRVHRRARTLRPALFFELIEPLQNTSKISPWPGFTNGSYMTCSDKADCAATDELNFQTK